MVFFFVDIMCRINTPDTYSVYLGTYLSCTSSPGSEQNWIFFVTHDRNNYIGT